MIHRMNRRELWDLSPRDSARLNDRYGEYLSQLEATHERKVREQQGRNEIEQGIDHEVARTEN